MGNGKNYDRWERVERKKWRREKEINKEGIYVKKKGRRKSNERRRGTKKIERSKSKSKKWK